MQLLLTNITTTTQPQGGRSVVAWNRGTEKTEALRTEFPELVKVAATAAEVKKKGRAKLASLTDTTIVNEATSLTDRQNYVCRSLQHAV